MLAIWSGASKTKKAQINKGFRVLRDRSIAYTFSKNFFATATVPESRERPYLAGKDVNKVTNFRALWNSAKVGDILCVRGGYGAIRLLKGLDKVKLKKMPKRVWGFSDMTILQHYLYFRLGAAWVHSPMLTSPSFTRPKGLEKKFWKESQRNKKETWTFPLQKFADYRPLPSSFPQDLPLLGGNLASLLTLFGTPWQPRPRAPFYLFLEEISEPGYKLDRLLTQLASSDFLDNCKAVLLGHFTDCAGDEGILKKWAEENKLLVLTGLPCGHDNPNIPLPMGVPVKLEWKKSSQKISLTVPIPRFQC